MYWLNGSTMTVPTRTAMSARTMRVRSSPRCSMKDIFASSTERGMSLPVPDEVPQRADAAAHLETFADRRGHVCLRLADRVLQRVAAGQARRDRRRERAARPVRVARGQARPREAGEVAPVPQDVGGRIAEVS